MGLENIIKEIIYNALNAIVPAITVQAHRQTNVIAVIDQLIKDIFSKTNACVLLIMLMFMGYVRLEFEPHVRKKDTNLILIYSNVWKLVVME